MYETPLLLQGNVWKSKHCDNRDLTSVQHDASLWFMHSGMCKCSKMMH